MRHRIMAVLTAVLALTLLAGAQPAFAADSVTIRPGKLQRGENPQIPFQDRTVILDGDVRVDVDTKGLLLVGKSGDEYVVVTFGNGNRYRVQRVDADGNLTLVRKGGPALAQIVLSDDGSRFAVVNHRRKRSTVRVFDAFTGSRLASRVVRGTATVLDLDDQQVVIGTWGPHRTLSWNTTTGRRTILRNKTGYAASIGADRVAWYTKDPYRNGCSVVAPLSDVRTELWRSCRQRVVEFSPDGARVATIHLLSDGLGPNQVQQREIDGTLLLRYDVKGWFGRIAWEDDDTLLMDANGRKRAAVVRCDGSACERASRLRRPLP